MLLVLGCSQQQQAVLDLMNAIGLIMDALPPTAPPLLATREDLRASLATSTLAAMKSPKATPLCRARLLHALYRLLGAKHLLEAASRPPVSPPPVPPPPPQSMGSSGDASEKEAIPSSLQASSGQSPAIPLSSWWDDVYRTLKPSMPGLGSRQLSGLLYLLAKMVDVTGKPSSTYAPYGFEGPPVEWVEEALHYIAGERRHDKEHALVGGA